MPITVGHDTAKTRKTLTVGDQSIAYYSIPAATEAGLGDFSNLPAALKVVLENMLRFEDDKTVTVDDIKAFAEWGAKGGKNPREIAYRPARVLMQDFTGVPAVVAQVCEATGLEHPQILTVGFGARSLPYYTHRPARWIAPRVLPATWAAMRKDDLVLLADPEWWDAFATDPNWDLSERFEPVDLEATIRSTVDLFEGIASERGLALHLEFSAGHLGLVEADPYRLRQIVSNLLGNALKFTQEGSVRVSVVAPDDGTNVWQITVADTGIGIPADKLEQVFAAFSQVEDGSNKTYQGTGLGLAICRDLADLFGGRINVESTPEVGSKFHCYLPLSSVESESESSSDPAYNGGEAIGDRQRVLVVEDNQDNLLVSQQMLELLNYEVTEASSGHEALALMDSASYAAILMDVQMPGMDGFETTRCIREGASINSKTPIIALTANAMIGDRERCIEAGMSDYLSKPCRMKDLEDTLARWVGVGRPGLG